MPIKKLSGRQDVIVANADFTFSDVTPSGVYQAAVDLPAGAIVTSGGLSISTAFNSGTSDTFSIGDKEGSAAAAGTAYAAAAARAAGGSNPIVPTGKKYTVPSTVGVLWTGVGAAPTAGVGRLTVHYFVDGRANFSQG